ncbi:MAG: response regulator transcription factor [Microbacteriaceae bacterium]|nr:response regulator transcription factor [Microbacteriaceae bacterium]MCL2793889.1 response regulator transcription factor [Microbacteriaceae bacterium]
MPRHPLDLPPVRRADGTPARAIVVDDEEALADAVALALESDGWATSTMYRGRDVAHAVRTQRPDVVVLDIMLPDLDGFAVLDRIRAVSDEVRVLFLTAKDSQQDRIDGLRAGGDDYVTKPFDIPELLARARALVRLAPSMTDAAAAGILSIGRLALDEDARTATCDGTPLELTATEFEVLRFFARNEGKALRREQLLTSVWGYDFGAESNLVEMYVSTLRRKLPDDCGIVIQTIRGVGYILKTTDAPAGDPA